MKYECFEQLPVWQKAAQLAADIFRWSAQSVFRNKGDLANQLQRAALSISNNIAEGFERGTTNDLITFLYYARGSAGEVRSILSVMLLMKDFDPLKQDIEQFRQSAETIARQIRGWTDFLQNTDIKGQKYLNDNTRTQAQNAKSREAFLRTLDVLAKKSFSPPESIT